MPTPTSRRRYSAGGRSSRLYKKLVYETQIAQDVTVNQQSLILGSQFQIAVTARPGHTLDEIERAVDAEIAGVADERPDAREVERARNTIETQIITGLETLGGFGGVADRLNSYNHYLKTPDYLQQRHRALSRRDAGERAGVRQSATHAEFTGRGERDQGHTEPDRAADASGGAVGAGTGR